MADENTSGSGPPDGQAQQTSAADNQQVQETQSTQTQNQPRQQIQSPPPFIADLKASLDSLPERVAMAISEAMPKQQAPPQSQSQSKSTTDDHPSDTTGSDRKGGQGSSDSGRAQKDQTPPGSKNFTEWWMGVPAGTHRQ
jgi:hypothetical protein